MRPLGVSEANRETEWFSGRLIAQSSDFDSLRCAMEHAPGRLGGMHKFSSIARRFLGGEMAKCNSPLRFCSPMLAAACLFGLLSCGNEQSEEESRSNSTSVQPRSVVDEVAAWGAIGGAIVPGDICQRVTMAGDRNAAHMHRPLMECYSGLSPNDRDLLQNPLEPLTQ